MKKIFISVPIKGRKESDIKYTIELMEKYILESLGEVAYKIEFINSFETYNIPKYVKKPNIYYLSKSLEKMSTCDVVAVLGGWGVKDFKQCDIEQDAAEKFGVKVIYCGHVRDFCPDMEIDERFLNPIFEEDNLFDV